MEFLALFQSFFLTVLWILHNAELGLYSLRKRRWRSKLIFFFKIINGMLPDYLYSYLEFPSQEKYPLRSASANIILPIPTRTKTFKNTFFPFCINEWNNLAKETRNAKSINIFKKLISKEKKRKFFVFHLRSTWSEAPYSFKTSI